MRRPRPRCYRTIGSIVHMATTRREELVDVAARLFAERGYHGTSMADLAEAMGVQKGSLYSLTDSKQELLVAVARDGATAFHAALDRGPGRRAAARADPRGAARAPRGRGGPGRRGDGVHPRVAVPRGAGADGVPGRAPPLRGALGTTSCAKPPSAARSAPTSTSTRPCCSSSRPRTGRTPGSGPGLGHGRARRPLLRDPRRRRPRVRAAPGVASADMRRRLLIVNPQASGVTDALVEQVGEALPAARGRPHRARRAGDGDRGRHERDVDAIYVLSGDGTYNEVLNGVAGDDPARVPPRRRDERPSAGARARPRSGGRGAAPVAATTRRIGLGRVNGRRFAFNAGIGFDAELVRRIDSRGRREDGRRPGDLGVRPGGARAARRRRGRFPDALEVDGHGRAAFVLVANCDPYTYAGRVGIRVSRGGVVRPRDRRRRAVGRPRP